MTFVISSNSGWTAQRKVANVGRETRTVDQEKMAQATGGYAQRAERPEYSLPVFARAKETGTSAIINSVTYPKATAATAEFADCEYA